MELTYYESYYDPMMSVVNFGPRSIKLDDKLTYIKEKNYKYELQYIKEIKFGNPVFYDCLSYGRDIESHVLFRVNEFDDLVIIRRYNGFKYVFDRIEYLNVEYRIKK